MKRLLLIDGDEVVFKATSAIEQEVQWDSCNHVLWSNPEQAYDNFNGIVRRLYGRFECSRVDLILCFSGTYETPNFRLALDETYKRHRGRKPMCYWAVRERAQNDYRSLEFPGLEANDVMGIGALSAASDYYNDDRAGSFEARYKQIAQMLQEQADADELTADAAVRPALLFNNNRSNFDGVEW